MAPHLIRDWLLSLGTLTTTHGSADDLSLRINAMAAMLAGDFPPEAFTAFSLRHCAAMLKFFPSYAELLEVLSPWWREHRKTLEPLRIAREAAPLELPPERTEAELAAVSTMVREITAALRHNEVEKQAWYAGNVADWRKPAPKMTRAELNEAYKRASIKGPQVPQRTLRAVATKTPSDVKRGPITDEDSDAR